jgi:hypothetical protein
MIDPEVTMDDIVDLAKNLRPSDLAEIAAGSGSPAIESITRSVEVSSLVAAFRSSIGLLGLAGVAQFDGFSSPWMHGSTRIWRRQGLFLRDSVNFIKSIPAKMYPLANMTLAANMAGISWLRRIGFDVDNQITTIDGYHWRRFYMEAPNV